MAASREYGKRRSYDVCVAVCQGLTVYAWIPSYGVWMRESQHWYGDSTIISAQRWSPVSRSLFTFIAVLHLNIAHCLECVFAPCGFTYQKHYYTIEHLWWLMTNWKYFVEKIRNQLVTASSLKTHKSISNICTAHRDVIPWNILNGIHAHMHSIAAYYHARQGSDRMQCFSCLLYPLLMRESLSNKKTTAKRNVNRRKHNFHGYSSRCINYEKWNDLNRIQSIPKNMSSLTIRLTNRIKHATVTRCSKVIIGAQSRMCKLDQIVLNVQVNTNANRGSILRWDVSHQCCSGIIQATQI